MAKATPQEIIKQTLASKTIYFFVDTEKGIDQKSREVYKNKDVEVHFPIGFKGGDKYENIKEFIYEGFKGKLPVGVGKSPLRGLGFTKVLRPLIEYIEENIAIEKIKIIKSGKGYISESKKEICITEAMLIRLHTVFQNSYEKHKKENEVLASEQLHSYFPNEIKLEQRQYVKNSITSALSFWEQSIAEFSQNDKDAIRDLFDKLSLTKDFFTTESLLKTKESIDEKYIEDVIDQFKDLMNQRTETETLEKKWQEFLKSHSWIFSYIFSFPVILFEDEAYVGGKGVNNKNGKVTDFLVKNDLTQNVAFIEIKTHKTELVKAGSSYRGTDVFSMSSDLSGAITQVLNQRDNFQKHFATHRMNSPDLVFETFNSKCVVLMGSVKDLNKKQISSFELFRSNSKDVEIITFDELLARFENLQKLKAGKIK